jgi:hypothetical protein
MRNFLKFLSIALNIGLAFCMKEKKVSRWLFHPHLKVAAKGQKQILIRTCNRAMYSYITISFCGAACFVRKYIVRKSDWKTLMPMYVSQRLQPPLLHSQMYYLRTLHVRNTYFTYVHVQQTYLWTQKLDILSMGKLLRWTDRTKLLRPALPFFLCFNPKKWRHEHFATYVMLGLLDLIWPTVPLNKNKRRRRQARWGDTRLARSFLVQHTKA